MSLKPTCVLVAVLTACARTRDAPSSDTPRVVFRFSDSVPPPPRISAHVVAPSLIAVVIQIDTIEAGWLVGRARAVADLDTSESTVSLNQKQLSDTVWLHAEPAKRYLVSAQLESTRVPSQKSRWTAAVRLEVPRAPSTAPQAPASLTARAESPYAVRLAWQDRSESEHGFAIERAAAGKPTFERVAVVRTNVTSWTHHALGPNDLGTYRVVSFNPIGVSAPSEPVAATTLADVTQVTGYAAPGAAKDGSDCLTGEIDLSNTEGALSGQPPRLYRNISFGQHRVDMLLDLCGNANCNVSLFAMLGGCKRSIGDLFFVPGDSTSPGWTVRALDPHGWPVITTIGHSSYSTFSVNTWQLIDGKYRPVDAAFHCGTVRDVSWPSRVRDDPSDEEDPRTADLRTFRPPFQECQFDDPPSSK